MLFAGRNCEREAVSGELLPRGGSKEWPGESTLLSKLYRARHTVIHLARNDIICFSCCVLFD